jgi:hypothetical protein
MPQSNIGDYIVGKYNDDGKKISPGKYVGSKTEVEALRAKYAQHASKRGEPLIVDAEPKKKLRKKRVPKMVTPKKVDYTVQEESEYVTTDLEPMNLFEEATEAIHEEEINLAAIRQLSNDEEHWVPATGSASKGVEKKKVLFMHDFGTNRVKVLDIISAGETGVMLVFENDDDVSYIPKVGQTLSLVDPDGLEIPVYYPGLLFDWTDGVKKVMILVKLHEDIDEVDDEYKE